MKTESIFTKGVYVALFCACILFVFPFQTEAYETTNQRSIPLTDSSALFVIDFSFGHERYDVYVPFLTTYGEQQKNNSLSYSIQNNEGEDVIGSATGVVLSSANIVNGMYRIPKGVKQHFSLVVLVQLDENDIGAEYWTKVHHLPFTFSTTQQLGLNPSELTAYKTPAIRLK